MLNKNLTKGREIPFDIHMYSLTDSVRKYYQTSTICQAGAMRGGLGGQWERQGLVLRHQKLELQAQEDSRVFLFCFVSSRVLLFPSLGFLAEFGMFRCDLS